MFDNAIAHDDDTIGQRHRFDLIVGHIDDGGLHLVVQFLDFDPHLRTQLGVEIGQRFVKQEHVGMAHDGAPHGDALALATG